MVITNQEFVRQGWQCPICEKVYAPQTPMCLFCPPKTETKAFGDVGTGKPPDKPQIIYSVRYPERRMSIIENAERFSCPMLVHV